MSDYDSIAIYKGIDAAQAWKLRRDGNTYKKIGEIMGKSQHNIRTKVCGAARLLSSMQYHPHRFPEVNMDLLKIENVRVRRTIMYGGYYSLEEVRIGIMDGRLRPGSIPEYGLKSHEYLCAVCEIEDPFAKGELNRNVIELYKAYLERAGYIVTLGADDA